MTYIKIAAENQMRLDMFWNQLDAIWIQLDSVWI